MKRRTARLIERGTRIVLGLGVFNLAAYGAEWPTLASLGAATGALVLAAVIGGCSQYAEARRAMGDRS